MNPENTRRLWRLRFRRILQLEEESFAFYQKFLKEKPALVEASGLKPLLKEILRDEGRHILIAKKLLRLTGGETQQPD